MTRRLFPALLLAAFLTAPARADTPKQEKSAKGVVPFEILKTGHMTVKVKVNGKGPYRLIFDTGAPINLLNNKIAEEAGLLKGMRRSPFALFKTVAITRSARASAFASASFRVAHRRAHQASRRHQPPSVHPLLARVPLASARRAPSERTISPASTGIARLPGTCCGPVRDVEPNAGSRIITPRGRPGRRMDFRRARLGVGSCSRRPMCEPRSRWKPG